MKKIFSIWMVAFLLIGLQKTNAQKLQLKNFQNPFAQKSSDKADNDRAISKPESKSDLKLEIIDGSFYLNLQKQKITVKELEEDLNRLLGLEGKHEFVKVSSKNDELGFNHNRYQHFYNDVKVDGSSLMIHSKEHVTSINGNVIDFQELNTNETITAEEAKKIAMEHLEVTDLIYDYPIEKVIVSIPTEGQTQPKLSFKVRIDSYEPFEMSYIYVDAKSGKVINEVPLIAHADTPSSGQTLYSGNQSFISDSYQGNYRLRESGRGIETYNATNATGLDSINGFIGSTDFVNSSTTWSGVLTLDSFTVTSIALSWWYNFFADQTPDLYIKVIDGNNQVVYTSNYINNTNPVVNWNNLGIILTDPPYTVELWDYDPVGGDDFGGSYNIPTTSGNHNWSGSGNNGSMTLVTIGNPALDVHWGMEVSYDFYMDSLGRNSYDDSGSVVRNFINPPLSSNNFPGWPNNAFAIQGSYNIMVYGMGDGVNLSPVVGLDVEGHEFSHLVIGNNGNGGLVYQGESGALNESFADIFGTCIEFSSGVNPDWLIGEDVMLIQPFYMRSMSNPNSANHPDTYQGTNWVNPTNLSNDKGGVHINSGVQNFWFYLLSQGGTGTNDLNNSYSVTGIGMSKARDIAYRNLTTYLTPNATFMDAYYGSLQAADDLFGNPSTEYTAVQEAWYAVGVGANPNAGYCSGTVNLTDTAGTFTDGSGTADYDNNADCKWVIAPPGATQISLSFTSMDVETDYDTVFVYDGPDDTYPLIATWWGTTLPPTYTTTSGVGAMCVKFKTDVSVTEDGWSASYSSSGVVPSCNGGTVLADSTGTLSDGSGTSNYGNNQLCYWYIAPPCADSVRLSFSQFDTENGYDGVIVYDDWNGTTPLGIYSGTTTPSPVTSTTGKMLVIFTSDYSFSQQGFTASYTTYGAASCSGNSNLASSDWGFTSDGSGANNYCNNSNCEWLIQPPQATSVSLEFLSFDLEAASPDGSTIYDAVEIYDGTTSNDSLLGRFTGNNIPPTITSSSGNMLVKFYSDIEVNAQGWSAYYTSTQASHCSTDTLTNSNDTLSDGSGNALYANNSHCSWLIQPPNASTISLNFLAFNTEANYDGVLIYDGIDTSGTLLGQFSGNTIPSTVTANSGSMYVEFTSDPAERDSGWVATYSTTLVGLEENTKQSDLSVFPNPSSGIFTVEHNSKNGLTPFEVRDITSKIVLKGSLNDNQSTIDLSDKSNGVYYLRIGGENVKIIKQ